MNCTLTSSGADANKPCVFPFIYMEETFNSCTTIDSDLEVFVYFVNSINHDCTQAWCSTEVDSYGRLKEGFWGFCAADCPGCKTETCPTTTKKTTTFKTTTTIGKEVQDDDYYDYYDYESTECKTVRY